MIPSHETKKVNARCPECGREREMRLNKVRRFSDGTTERYIYLFFCECGFEGQITTRAKEKKVYRVDVETKVTYTEVPK